jgi:hypothetical protein
MARKNFQARPGENYGADLTDANSPAVGLRELLTYAKRRRVPFDRAWAEALAVLDLPAPRAGDIGAVGWHHALRTTRASWQAAYENRPDAEGEGIGALAVAGRFEVMA